MQNMVDLAMLQTNMAFDNAGSNVRVRLVHTHEDKEFPDDRGISPFDSLVRKGDGHFDCVDCLRAKHGADIIVI